MVKHIISLNTLADLKLMPGQDTNPILLLGKTNIGDGFAAHYYWDDNSVDVDDPTYLNTVKVTAVDIGRWKKVIAKVQTLPHGFLVSNGGKKEFFASGVTIADGTCTLNLTMDNTVNGTPIFTEIWFDDSKATVNTTNVYDAVSSTRKSLTNSNKQLTHLFFRGQAPVISVVGISVVNIAQRPAATGTPVQFKVEGI